MKRIIIDIDKWSPVYTMTICEDDDNTIFGKVLVADGEFIKNPRFLQESLREMRCLQRSLSRKKQYSKNWEEQRIRLAKLYQKIKRQRKDFLHKISTQLVLDNKLIIIEDLRIEDVIKDIIIPYYCTTESNDVNCPKDIKMIVKPNDSDEFKRMLEKEFKR
jgi:hypothetical protein